MVLGIQGRPGVFRGRLRVRLPVGHFSDARHGARRRRDIRRHVGDANHAGDLVVFIAVRSCRFGLSWEDWRLRF